MRPPENNRYLTPDEFDDSRWCDAYWVTSIMVAVVMVLVGSYTLTRWCGWTGRAVVPVLGAGVIGWALIATLVYVVWARARRRRRGGRR